MGRAKRPLLRPPQPSVACRRSPLPGAYTAPLCLRGSCQDTQSARLPPPSPLSGAAIRARSGHAVGPSPAPPAHGTPALAEPSPSLPAPLLTGARDSQPALPSRAEPEPARPPLDRGKGLAACFAEPSRARACLPCPSRERRPAKPALTWPSRTCPCPQAAAACACDRPHLLLPSRARAAPLHARFIALGPRPAHPSGRRRLAAGPLGPSLPHLRSKG